MINNAKPFGKYVVDFEYALVSVNTLTESKISSSNTLIDNIFLADKKRTREDWTDGIAELMHRIRAMDTNDLNEWITWFPLYHLLCSLSLLEVHLVSMHSHK